MRFKFLILLFLPATIWTQNEPMILSAYYAFPINAIGFGYSGVFYLAIEGTIPNGVEFYENISKELAENWGDRKIDEYDLRVALFLGRTIEIKKQILYANFALGFCAISHREIYEDKLGILGRGTGKYEIETSSKKTPDFQLGLFYFPNKKKVGFCLFFNILYPALKVGISFQ